MVFSCPLFCETELQISCCLICPFSTLPWDDEQSFEPLPVIFESLSYGNVSPVLHCYSLHPGLDHRNCPITHTPGSFIGLTQDIHLPAPPIPASCGAYSTSSAHHNRYWFPYFHSAQSLLAEPSLYVTKMFRLPSFCPAKYSKTENDVSSIRDTGHSNVLPVSMHFVVKFVFPEVSIDLKGWIGSSTDYWSPPASSLQLALPINLAPNEANYRSEAFMGWRIYVGAGGPIPIQYGDGQEWIRSQSDTDHNPEGKKKESEEGREGAGGFTFMIAG